LVTFGKMGKTEKNRRENRKENHATKVTKIPKTKRRKYGMNETYITLKLLKSYLYYYVDDNCCELCKNRIEFLSKSSSRVLHQIQYNQYCDKITNRVLVLHYLWFLKKSCEIQIRVHLCHT
jgi:hypothetical protein